MADGTDTRAGTADGKLRYLLSAAPATGELVAVARDVWLLRLPLPFQLDHINAYILADGDGVAIVDTGIQSSQTKAAWLVAMETAFPGKPVTRVICTHMHPDHIGLAGWFCDGGKVPLWMSRTEYLMARTLIGEGGGDAPPESEAFYRAAGWSEDQLADWRKAYGGFGRGVAPMPRAYVRMRDGDEVRIGQDDWTVVVGAGHSPEHVCLWRKSDNVFLAGDQILPRISSNVSVGPTEPLASPLDDWMDSLDRLEALLPDDMLVLPSHGEPFYGVKPRLQALRRGHGVALKRLERTLRKPSRVVDAFTAVFGRSLDDGVLGMATGEALAHLVYLERRNRAQRVRDESGVDWWSATEKMGEDQ